MSATVLQFPWLGRPKQEDGGKARIKKRRASRNLAEPVYDWRDEDLTMDHVDNGIPSDSAYCAPDTDPA